jgi:malate dehydrogenase
MPCARLPLCQRAAAQLRAPQPSLGDCVRVQVVPDVPFFATKVQLGPEGIARVLGLGPMIDFEKQALEAMLPELKEQIAKGIAFASS